MSLTPKQEKFCQKYIEIGCKSEAYRQAYKAEKMKPATVNRAAHDLFKNPKITTRVAVLTAEYKKQHEVTVDRIVEELEKMAFVDVRRFLNPDGSMKKLAELDRRTAASLVNFEVEDLFDGTGEQRKHYGRLTKVKLADKKASLDSLARVFGAFNDTVHNVNETYEEMIARLEAEEKEKNEQHDG